MAKGGRDRKCEILVINNIAQVGLKRFPPSATRWSRSQGSVGHPRALAGPAQVRVRTVAARRRTRRRGREQHPVAALSKRGVPVFNAPGANANAVKELVLAGMLIAARNLAPALDFVQKQKPAPDLDKRRKARSSPGSSCPGTRWASSAWERLAAWSPTRRFAWA